MHSFQLSFSLLNVFVWPNLLLWVSSTRKECFMATMNDVMEGMKIIFRYAPHEQIIGHNFAAEHDQIWCGEYTGDKMSEQHPILRSKLLGHYQYYGIRGNYQMMDVYFRHAIKSWRRWLGRRSRNGYITCNEFSERFLKVFPLPPPRIVHSC